MSASEAETVQDPERWGTHMSDFRVGSRILRSYARREKPGPKNSEKHRHKKSKHKKRLAKGLDEFARFVGLVAAEVQESAPELGQS